MASAPILGTFAFRGFEVPERVSFGGRQKLVVHALPGGGRVVDAMGPDEASIRWAGVFSGGDASGRVRLLERMRRAGDVVALSWDAWRYSVLIEEFQAEVTSPWWIPYRIELCVLPEGGSGLVDPVLAAFDTVQDVAGLNAGIALASANLQAADLGGVVSAAGDLARLTLARAGVGLTS